MSIAAWNIVLNAVVGVLIVGYGLWLKYVIDQQLKSKDTAIQALEAAIKTKDAEIAILKSDTAPAITQAYNTMRQHANQMTEESQRLSAKVSDATEQLEKIVKAIPISQAGFQAEAINKAIGILYENLGKVIFGKSGEPSMPEPSPELFIAMVHGYLATFEKLNAEMDSLIGKGYGLAEIAFPLKNKEPV
ncbi:MAG TPA: hypothetical protein VJW20_16150 [Candidatus Angelobacter sp.]|nr:hypothetical protein [Candidatus Angelobacter sp.]